MISLMVKIYFSSRAGFCVWVLSNKNRILADLGVFQFTAADRTRKWLLTKFHNYVRF